MNNRIIILTLFLSLFLSLSVFSQKIFKNVSSLYGLKNSENEIIIEPIYKFIEEIEVAKPLNVSTYYFYSQYNPSKRYVVIKSKEDKYGLMDMNGKEVLPTENDYIHKEMSVDSILFFRNSKEKYSIIDLKTKKVVETEFYHVDTFYEGLAKFMLSDDLRGYIDKNGNIIIIPIYKSCSDFSEGIAKVYNDKNDIAYINKEGKEITPFKYDYAEDFAQGIGIVNIGGEWNKNGHFTGGKYGLVDDNGNEISEFKYDLIKPFTFLNTHQIPVNKGAKFETDCPCIKGGKWAIYDIVNKEEVTDFIFDEIWTNKDLENVYSIKIDGKYGLVNDKFENITSVEYDFFSYVSELKLFRVKQNNMMGMINEKGEVIVPIEFEWINYNAIKNEIKVKKDGRQFIIDEKGNEIK